MGQIQKRLGDLLELQAPHLVHHQRQYHRYGESDNQLQQADDHRIAQDGQERCLGEQLHELIEAHPRALCRIILVIIQERDSQPSHGHILEDHKEQDSGNQQEVQPTVLYHILPCGLAPDFEVHFFRAFVFCHFHTLLSHICSDGLVFSTILHYLMHNCTILSFFIPGLIRAFVCAFSCLY